MRELCANACRGATTRRGALGLSFSALTAAFAISSGNQHQKTPPETQNVIAPDAALDRLMKGNDRYVQGVSCRHDFAHEREALAGGQNPFAAVLSCADSRIAPECFDTARGDLFVCRIAGNCERRNDRQSRIRSAGPQHAVDHFLDTMPAARSMPRSNPSRTARHYPAICPPWSRR